MSDAPIKALLIDDEPPANAAMLAVLTEHCPKIEVAEICLSAQKASEAIIRHRPDLVFMDIAMPGESGIEFLQRLGAFDFEVIFVSAHNQYAIDAFRLSAVDYVLKPISPALVVEAVAKAADRLRQKRELDRFRILFDLMQGQGGRMVLPGRAGVQEVVRIPEIIFLEAEEHCTHFHLLDGRKLTTGTNLGEYRSALLPYDFMQTHRSFLVNLRRVRSYDASEEKLLMECGLRVSLSRQYKKEVLEWLKRI